MTTRCGVAGSPIAHSLSPALHRAAYAHLGLDWEYDRHEVAEDGLGEFLDGLDDTWRGLSLTMPLKHEAVRLATRRVRSGLAGGRREHPRLRGRAAVRGEHRRTRAGGGPAGARRPERGPCHCRSVAAPPRRSAVAALAGIAGRVDGRRPEPGPRREGCCGSRTPSASGADVLPWSDADRALTAPLVVATTPKGAADALSASVPQTPGVLFDVLYDPWPTPLAAAWGSAGGTVLGGLDLLVHQAVLQVELMTGSAVPVDVLRRALPQPGSVAAAT